MRIQIEPTENIVELDGIPCRAWNGVTDAGIGVVVFVHRIVCKPGPDQFGLDVELAEMPPPRSTSSPEAAAADKEAGKGAHHAREASAETSPDRDKTGGRESD